MRTRLKALLLTVFAMLAAASCGNPYEQFALVQETQPEDLRLGISFDLPMEAGIYYSTAVVCRIDASDLFKETVDLTFDVISPNHESFKETVAFPVVSNVRQKNALGSDSQVLFKKRCAWLDNQWGWRRNITCDSIPGRWRVIISTKDETDLNRIRAIGFSYKGSFYEQE
jgi:hypothetical protein